MFTFGEWVTLVNSISEEDQQQIRELEEWIGQLENCMENCEKDTYEWSEYKLQLEQANTRLHTLKTPWPKPSNMWVGSASGWAFAKDWDLTENTSWGNIYYGPTVYIPSPKEVPIPKNIFDHIHKANPDIDETSEFIPAKLSGLRSFKYLIPSMNKESFEVNTISLPVICIHIEGPHFHEVLYYVYLASIDRVMYEYVIRPSPQKSGWGRK